MHAHRNRRPDRALLGAVVAALIVASLASPAAAGRTDPPPAPLIWEHGFADPAVAAYGDGVVAAATGRGNAIRAMAAGPAGPWQDLAPALESWPAWAAVPDHSVWGPDLVRVGNRWLLYYAVRVRGLGRTGRCIGVALAPTPDSPFTPVGNRPLVCPAGADTPRAEDRVRRSPALPRQGVIDPSLFRSRKGRLYLLYRTQGMPSTIRMVRLAGSGVTVPDSRRSHELVRNAGIVENPVLVQRGGQYVLLVSEGWFGHCRYRTLWQRSRSVWNWSGSRGRVLMDRDSTGLCGPGGADVLTRHRVSRIYFHGWVCGEIPRPCPRGFAKEPGVDTPGERRALYAARLRWTASARPWLGRFLGQ